MNWTSKGFKPMDRFMTESAAEQASLFVRPDTGRLSTSKDCCCKAFVEDQKVLKHPNHETKEGIAAR